MKKFELFEEASEGIKFRLGEERFSLLIVAPKCEEEACLKHLGRATMLRWLNEWCGGDTCLYMVILPYQLYLSCCKSYGQWGTESI